MQEEEEMIAWGKQAIHALTITGDDTSALAGWERHLRAFLVQARGITGQLATPEVLPLPTPRSDGRPYEMNTTPRRDGRFTNSFDQSHWKYVDEGLDRHHRDMAADEIALALLYRRLREMDVPEYMAPIIYKVRGRPWDYYRDLSRQAWDEARHAMMGEVGLFANDIAFYEYPIELEGSMTLNTAFTPEEAHVVLWAVEQGLMRGDTGKRFEWALATACGEELIARFQDYDWADEVLHAQIGRRWLVPEFGTISALQANATELLARWYVEMEKLIPPTPGPDWWPQLVGDLRKMRRLHAASVHLVPRAET